MGTVAATLKLEADSEGRKIKVVRRCVATWMWKEYVLGYCRKRLRTWRKELAPFAVSTVHKIEVNLAKTFMKVLYTFPAFSGPLASDGNCVLKSKFNR